MAKIYTRKDSPYYWCAWKRPDGTRARQKTGCPVAPNNASTSDVRQYQDNAQLKANKLEADDYKDYNPHKEHRNSPTLYFFDDLMLKYVEDRSLGKGDMNCIKNLYRFFSGYCLNDADGFINTKMECSFLDADAITEYKAKRISTQCRGKTISPVTVRRELATLSAAINYARFEWNWKIPNVVEGRKPKAGKPRIIWATPEEMFRLLQAAKKVYKAPHLVDFIELGLNTGMRKMEMLACELNRVDLRNGMIYLDPDDQKNAQYGSIPLNKTAKQAIVRRLSFIEEHCPETRWLFPYLGHGEKGESHINCVKHSFTTACKMADVAHLFPHALRHTFCSWLLQAGVSIYLVKDCMRHASITQTEEYGHLVPKNRRDSVLILDDVVLKPASTNELSRICHANDSAPLLSTEVLDDFSYNSVG